MDYRPLIYSLKDITPQEFQFLQKIMESMTEAQAREFIMFYSGKRKTPSEILLLTLIGFLGVAGIERFVIGQIGMGILYLLTGGLCLIGTIVDAINHKSLARENNEKAALESAGMVRRML
ncbi:TM2 domain-containing protein [Pedobacter sp. SYSU D00535]|uniref:TM2 domain-containing protein n=1 Tax=Pedobacter sp. SYSU D00535 TaxID=2810308 RepID=UPI001A957FBC|nr:TM2 domain-containing protein [Pedobacter sp. SYSU D00535]